jgi:hypothetical protein
MHTKLPPLVKLIIFHALPWDRAASPTAQSFSDSFFLSNHPSMMHLPDGRAPRAYFPIL